MKWTRTLCLLACAAFGPLSCGDATHAAAEADAGPTTRAADVAAGADMRNASDASSKAAAATRPAAVVLTRQDTGKEIVLAPGDRLSVELPAQLGTGQLWQVTSGPDVDAPSLRLRPDAPDYTKQSGVPGGEDVAVFTYDALRPGVTEVRLTYGRPRKASAEFRVTVKVAERPAK